MLLFRCRSRLFIMVNGSQTYQYFAANPATEFFNKIGQEERFPRRRLRVRCGSNFPVPRRWREGPESAEDGISSPLCRSDWRHPTAEWGNFRSFTWMPCFATTCSMENSSIHIVRRRDPFSTEMPNRHGPVPSKKSHSGARPADPFVKGKEGVSPDHSRGA